MQSNTQFTNSCHPTNFSSPVVSQNEGIERPRSRLRLCLSAPILFLKSLNPQFVAGNNQSLDKNIKSLYGGYNIKQQETSDSIIPAVEFAAKIASVNILPEAEGEYVQQTLNWIAATRIAKNTYQYFSSKIRLRKEKQLADNAKAKSQALESNLENDQSSKIVSNKKNSFSKKNLLCAGMGLAMLTSAAGADSSANRLKPKEISSFDQLKQIGNSPDYPLDGYYQQVEDIDASNINLSNDNGYLISHFTGVYEGQGFRILNLPCSLFGLLEGKVFNLSLTDARVQADIIFQEDNMGVLTREAKQATIENIRVTGCVLEFTSSNMTYEHDDSDKSKPIGLGALAGKLTECQVHKIFLENNTISDVSQFGHTTGLPFR